MSRAPVWPGEMRRALAWGARRLPFVRLFLTTSACIAAPAFLVVFLLVHGVREDLLGIDFDRAFLHASRAVLHGEQVLPLVDDPSLPAGTAYVYPPLTAIAVAPFALLPSAVANAIFTALLAVCVVATLRALDVRDWRCYGIVFLWAPVFSALQTGNLTILLGLAAALAWRWRERPARAGLAVGVSLAAKLFLWPLLVWFVAVRRRRAAMIALAGSVGLTVLTWGALGFAGIVRYPALLQRLSDLEAPVSYTLYALALDLGVGAPVARALWLGAGAALLAAAVLLARRGESRRAFAAAVIAAIALSPIVWMHYFALLLVPVALASTTLSVAWLLPVLFWGGSADHNGATWQTAYVLGVAGVITAASLVELARKDAPAKRLSARPGLARSS